VLGLKLGRFARPLLEPKAHYHAAPHRVTKCSIRRASPCHPAPDELLGTGEHGVRIVTFIDCSANECDPTIKTMSHRQNVTRAPIIY
jgi:hypothetical protein